MARIPISDAEAPEEETDFQEIESPESSELTQDEEPGRDSFSAPQPTLVLTSDELGLPEPSGSGTDYSVRGVPDSMPLLDDIDLTVPQPDDPGAHRYASDLADRNIAPLFDQSSDEEDVLAAPDEKAPTAADVWKELRRAERQTYYDVAERYRQAIQTGRIPDGARAEIEKELRALEVRADLTTEELETLDKSGSGFFGELGQLSWDESQKLAVERLAAERDRFARQEARVKKLEARNASLANEIGLDEIKTGPLAEELLFARKVLESNKSDISKYENYAKGQGVGFLYSPARNLADVSINLFAKTLTKSVEGLGIVGGAGLSSLGLDVDSDDNVVYRLGKAATEWVDRIAPGDPARQEDLTTKVASAVGSAAGFMATNGLGFLRFISKDPSKMYAFYTVIDGSRIGASVGLGLANSGSAARLAGVGAVGGLQGGVSEYDAATEVIKRAAQEYALSHGVMKFSPSEADRLKAFGLGFLLGTSELLPFANGIGVAGSRLGIGQAINGFVKEGIEEAAQETVEGLGSNLIAGLYYDPKRDPWEGVAEGAAIGLIVGGAMGAGTEALQGISAVRRLKRKASDLGTTFLDSDLNSGSIDLAESLLELRARGEEIIRHDGFPDPFATQVAAMASVAKGDKGRSDEISTAEEVSFLQAGIYANRQAQRELRSRMMDVGKRGTTDDATEISAQYSALYSGIRAAEKRLRDLGVEPLDFDLRDVEDTRVESEGETEVQPVDVPSVDDGAESDSGQEFALPATPTAPSDEEPPENGAARAISVEQELAALEASIAADRASQAELRERIRSASGDDRAAIIEQHSTLQARIRGYQEKISRLSHPSPPSDLPEVRDVSPDDVGVEPHVYQLKSGRSFTGDGTDSGAQEPFDRERSGSLLLHEWEDGRLYVADGHNTISSARKSSSPEEQLTLPGIVIKEADGITRDDAALVAAYKNLAEGNMPATDAMILMSEHGIGPEDMPERSPALQITQGFRLLSSAAKRLVLDEQVPANYAAMVGELISDQSLHEPIVSAIAQVQPRTGFEARAVIAQAQREIDSAPFQIDRLLPASITDGLYRERARILGLSAPIILSDVTGIDAILASRMLIDISNTEGPTENALTEAANILRSGTGNATARAVNKFLESVNPEAFRAATPRVLKRRSGSPGGAREAIKIATVKPAEMIKQDAAPPKTLGEIIDETRRSLTQRDDTYWKNSFHDILTRRNEKNIYEISPKNWKNALQKLGANEDIFNKLIDYALSKKLIRRRGDSFSRVPNVADVINSLSLGVESLSGNSSATSTKAKKEGAETVATVADIARAKEIRSAISELETAPGDGVFIADLAERVRPKGEPISLDLAMKISSSGPRGTKTHVRTLLSAEHDAKLFDVHLKKLETSIKPRKKGNLDLLRSVYSGYTGVKWSNKQTKSDLISAIQGVRNDRAVRYLAERSGGGPAASLSAVITADHSKLAITETMLGSMDWTSEPAARAISNGKPYSIEDQVFDTFADAVSESSDLYHDINFGIISGWSPVAGSGSTTLNLIDLNANTKDPKEKITVTADITIAISMANGDSKWVRIDAEIALRGLALMVPVDGQFVVVINPLIPYDVPIGSSLVKHVRGRIIHERIHYLFATKRISGIARQRLLELALKLDIPNLPHQSLSNFLHGVTDSIERRSGTLSLQDVYKQLYANRLPEWAADILEEEYICHMLELRERLLALDVDLPGVETISDLLPVIYNTQSVESPAALLRVIGGETANYEGDGYTARRSVNKNSVRYDLFDGGGKKVSLLLEPKNDFSARLRVVAGSNNDDAVFEASALYAIAQGELSEYAFRIVPGNLNKISEVELALFVSRDPLALIDATRGYEHTDDIKRIAEMAQSAAVEKYGSLSLPMASVGGTREIERIIMEHSGASSLSPAWSGQSGDISPNIGQPYSKLSPIELELARQAAVAIEPAEYSDIPSGTDSFWPASMTLSQPEEAEIYGLSDVEVVSKIADKLEFLYSENIHISARQRALTISLFVLDEWRTLSSNDLQRELSPEQLKAIEEIQRLFVDRDGRQRLSTGVLNDMFSAIKRRTPKPVGQDGAAPDPGTHPVDNFYAPRYLAAMAASAFGVDERKRSYATAALRHTANALLAIHESGYYEAPRPLLDSVLSFLRDNAAISTHRGWSTGVVSRVSARNDDSESLDLEIKTLDGRTITDNIPVETFLSARAITSVSAKAFYILQAAPVDSAFLESRTDRDDGLAVGIENRARAIGIDPILIDHLRDGAYHGGALRSIIIHERVHILRLSGVLVGPVWRALTRVANEMRVLDIDRHVFNSFREGRGRLSIANRAEATIRAPYEKMYRSLLSDRGAMEMMDQESVAHLMEILEVTRASGQSIPDMGPATPGIAVIYGSLDSGMTIDPKRNAERMSSRGVTQLDSGLLIRTSQSDAVNYTLKLLDGQYLNVAGAIDSQGFLRIDNIDDLSEPAKTVYRIIISEAHSDGLLPMPKTLPSGGSSQFWLDQSPVGVYLSTFEAPPGARRDDLYEAAVMTLKEKLDDGIAGRSAFMLTGTHSAVKVALEKIVKSNNSKRMKPSAWLNKLINESARNGVKKEEIDALGLPTFASELELSGVNSVDASAILSYVEANAVDLDEVHLSKDDGETSYEYNSIPEGSKYHETLITFNDAKLKWAILPIKGMQAPHYTGHYNIVVAVRWSVSVGRDSKETLFIHEIQSDAHQRGRNFGYIPIKEARELFNESTALEGDPYLQYEYEDNIVSPPDFPFKKTFAELAIKRMFMIAIDRGYAKVALARPEQIAPYVVTVPMITDIWWTRDGDEIRVQLGFDRPPNFEANEGGVKSNRIYNINNLSSIRSELGPRIAYKLELEIGNGGQSGTLSNLWEPSPFIQRTYGAELPAALSRVARMSGGEVESMVIPPESAFIDAIGPFISRLDEDTLRLAIDAAYDELGLKQDELYQDVEKEHLLNIIMDGVPLFSALNTLNDSDAGALVRAIAINAGFDLAAVNENPVVEITPEVTEFFRKSQPLFTIDRQFIHSNPLWRAPVDVIRAIDTAAQRVFGRRPTLRDRVLQRLPKNIEIEIDPAGPLASYRMADHKHIIQLSSAAIDGRHLTHEEIHALRLMDLFLDKEWNALTRAARRKACGLRHVNGEPMTYREAAELLYNTKMRYAGRFTGAELEEVLDQEAVAMMVEDARSLFIPRGDMPWLDKIVDFLKRLADILFKRGYRDFNDVVRKIEAGEIAERASLSMDTKFEMMEKSSDGKSGVYTYQVSRGAQRLGEIGIYYDDDKKYVSVIGLSLGSEDLPGYQLTSVLSPFGAQRFAQKLSADFPSAEDVLYRIPNGLPIKIGIKQKIGTTDPALRLVDSYAQIRDSQFETSLDFVETIGGPKSRRANRAALARAIIMETAGFSRDEIWETTWDAYGQGWYRGLDKKWRFEFSDGNSFFITPGATTLSTAIFHPTLFDHYPELYDVSLEINPRLETSGSAATYLGPEGTTYGIALQRDPRSMPRVLAHEIGHIIQSIEGFSPGGSSAVVMRSQFFRDYLKTSDYQTIKNAVKESTEGKLSSAYRELKELEATGVWDFRIFELNSSIEKMNNDLADLDGTTQKKLAYEIYKRILGEIEARMVERRLKLSDAERRERPPWLDYDIKDNFLFDVRGLGDNIEVVPLFAQDLIGNEEPSGGATPDQPSSRLIEDSLVEADASSDLGFYYAESGRIAFALSEKTKRLKAEGTSAQWINRNERTISDWRPVYKAGLAGLREIVKKRVDEAFSPAAIEAAITVDLRGYLERQRANPGLVNENVAAALQQYETEPEAAVAMIEAHIRQQRADGLAEWTQYLRETNADYAADPFWLDYVWRDVLGTMRKDWPDVPLSLNAAALENVYTAILAEPHNRPFHAVYSEESARLAYSTLKEQVEAGAGRSWIKIPRTSYDDPEYDSRVSAMQNLSCSTWCTAGAMASEYIKRGDFWVLRVDNESKLAIRFTLGKVAEIQGPANDGRIPVPYVGDLKKLLESEELTLRDRERQALETALEYSNRLDEVPKLISNKDYIGAFNALGVTARALDGGGVEIGSISQENNEIFLMIPKRKRDKLLATVVRATGDVYLNRGVRLPNMITVEGTLTLHEGAIANGVTTLGRNLVMYKGASANRVTTVPGNMVLHAGAIANGVTTLGGSLRMDKGASANLVTTVPGDLTLDEGAIANGVTTVHGSLIMHEGAIANGVTTLGGSLRMYKGTSANSITTVPGNMTLYPGASNNSVTTVHGDMVLHAGAIANGVTTLGGSLDMYKGASANLVTTVPGDMTLHEDAIANAVTTLGGSLIMYKGTSANSITTVPGDMTLLEDAIANAVTTVHGDMVLHAGASANRVTDVFRSVTMYKRASANRLTTVGNLRLYKGASNNSVTTVYGDMTLDKDTSANGVTTLGGSLRMDKGASANLVTTVPGDLTLDEGAIANGVTTLGGSLKMFKDTSANGVTTVPGNLIMYKGASANGVATVHGDLTMDTSASADALVSLGGSFTVHGVNSTAEQNAFKAKILRRISEHKRTVAGKKFASLFRVDRRWRLSTIGGMKAENAPISMQRVAQIMTARGAEKSAIWQRTGWMTGPDGMWRFEIDDSKAKIKNLSKILKSTKPSILLMRKSEKAPRGFKPGSVKVGKALLPDVLQHDTLYENYPFLKKMYVSIVLGEGVTPELAQGSLIFRSENGKIIYSPIIARAPTEAQLKKTLLHEVQHYIQKKEGFLRGSFSKEQPTYRVSFDPAAKTRKVVGLFQQATKANIRTGSDRIELTEAERLSLKLVDLWELYNATPDEFDKTYIRDQISSDQAALLNALKVTYDDYMSSSGELESQAVEERSEWSDDLRRATMPDLGGSSSDDQTTDPHVAMTESLRRAGFYKRLLDRLQSTPLDLDGDVSASWIGIERIRFSVPGSPHALDALLFFGREGNRRSQPAMAYIYFSEDANAQEPLSDSDRERLAGAAEKLLRSYNMEVTPDPYSAASSGIFTYSNNGLVQIPFMDDKTFLFWSRRYPTFGMNDIRKDYMESVISIPRPNPIPSDLIGIIDPLVWYESSAAYEKDPNNDLTLLQERLDVLRQQLSENRSRLDSIARAAVSAGRERSSYAEYEREMQLSEHIWNELTLVGLKITVGPLMEQYQSFMRIFNRLVDLENTPTKLYRAALKDRNFKAHVSKLALEKYGKAYVDEYDPVNNFDPLTFEDLERFSPELERVVPNVHDLAREYDSLTSDYDELLRQIKDAGGLSPHLVDKYAHLLNDRKRTNDGLYTIGGRGWKRLVDMGFGDPQTVELDNLDVSELLSGPVRGPVGSVILPEKISNDLLNLQKKKSAAIKRLHDLERDVVEKTRAPSAVGNFVQWVRNETSAGDVASWMGTEVADAYREFLKLVDPQDLMDIREADAATNTAPSIKGGLLSRTGDGGAAFSIDERALKALRDHVLHQYDTYSHDVEADKNLGLGDDAIVSTSDNRISLSRSLSVDFLTYEIFAELGDKSESIGEVQLQPRVNGWEIEWMTLVPEWRFGGELHRKFTPDLDIWDVAVDAIESDIGERNMKAPGRLTDAGYKRWTRRDPESVRWHRQFGKYWISPRRILEEHDNAESMLRDVIAGRRKDNNGSVLRRFNELNKIIADYPDELLSPEAMNRFFSIGKPDSGKSEPEDPIERLKKEVVDLNKKGLLGLTEGADNYTAEASRSAINVDNRIFHKVTNSMLGFGGGSIFAMQVPRQHMLPHELSADAGATPGLDLAPGRLHDILQSLAEAAGVIHKVGDFDPSLKDQAMRDFYRDRTQRLNTVKFHLKQAVTDRRRAVQAHYKAVDNQINEMQSLMAQAARERKAFKTDLESDIADRKKDLENLIGARRGRISDIRKYIKRRRRDIDAAIIHANAIPNRTRKSRRLQALMAEREQLVTMEETAVDDVRSALDNRIGDIRADITRLQSTPVPDSIVDILDQGQEAIAILRIRRKEPNTAANDALIAALRQQRDIIAAERADILMRGSYRLGTGIARTAFRYDVTALVHEIAHSMEQKFQDELRDFVVLHAADIGMFSYGADPSIAMSEGFANFLATYVTGSRSYLEVNVGTLLDDFELFIESIDPDLLIALDAAHEAYHAYREASAYGRTKTEIYKEEGDSGFARAMFNATWKYARSIQNDGFRWATRMQLMAFRHAISDSAPLKDIKTYLLREIESYTGERLTLPPTADPTTLHRVGRHHIAQSQSILEKGWTDPKTRQIVKTINPLTGKSVNLSLRVVLETAHGSPVAVWRDDVLDDFDHYLVARRAIWLWKRYHAGEIPMPPTWNSNDENGEGAWTQALKELVAKNPTFTAAAVLYDQFMDMRLKWELHTGRLSQDGYNNLRGNPYTPFMRYFEVDEKNDVPSFGKITRSNRGAFSKRLFGSDRPIMSPLQATIQLVDNTVEARVRNDVGRALRDLSLMAGPGASRYVEAAPESQIEAMRAELHTRIGNQAAEYGLNEFDDPLVMMAFTALHATTGKTNELGHKDLVYWIWDNGKPQPLILHDTELGRRVHSVITLSGSGGVRVLNELMNNFARIYRRMITAAPSFFLSNPLNDIVAQFMMFRDLYPGRAHLTGAWHMMNDTEQLHYFRAFSNMMGGQDTQIDELHIKRDLRAIEYGGWLGVSHLTKPGSMLSRLEKMGNSWWNAIRSDVFPYLPSPVRAFAHYSQFVESSETVGRAGRWIIVYKSVRKRHEQRIDRDVRNVMRQHGVGRRVAERIVDAPSRRSRVHQLAGMEASIVSQDMIDYSETGNVFKELAESVPFFAASTQGTHKFARLLTGDTDYGSLWFSIPREAIRKGPVGTAKALAGGLVNLVTTNPVEIEFLSDGERRAIADTLVFYTKVAGLYAGLQLAIYAMYGDSPEVRQLPNEIKMRHIVVPMDGVVHLVDMMSPEASKWLAEKATGLVFTIPGGFEFNFIPATVTRIVDDMKTDADVWAGILENTLETFVPNWLPPFIDVGAGAVFMALEKSGGIDISAGGKPIVPHHLKDLDPSLQFTPYTSPALTKLAADWNISPIQMQWLIETGGATLGRETIRILDMYTTENEIERKFDQMPVFSRFFKDPMRYSASRQEFRLQMFGEAGSSRKYVALKATQEDQLPFKDAAASLAAAIKIGDGKYVRKIWNKMDDNRKTYAILEALSTNSDLGFGSRKIGSIPKEYHPMHYAEELMKTLDGFSRDILASGTINSGAGRRFVSEKDRISMEPISLTPKERRLVIEYLQKIATYETENVLRLMEIPGRKNMGYYDTQNVWDEFRAVMPNIYERVEQVLRKNNTATWQSVRDTWPALKATLLDKTISEAILDGQTIDLGPYLQQFRLAPRG